MNINKPNYYAIIPATIRYDKDLSPNAKLLYGEITALSNDKGYCWANNQYFEELYNISDRTVRNLLKQLSDRHYISVIIENNTKRKIFIYDTPEEIFRGRGKIISSPQEKNFLHNNTNNKKMNIKEEEGTFEALFDYDWLNDEN